MGDSTNATSSPNLRPCDVVRTPVHAFFVVVYSLLFLVGLLLNGFIMKFYCCQAQQQASSSLMVYLKNLTAADFLLCLSLPLRISHYASSSPIVQELYCSFGASALYLNMYASIIFMGYIAANRYLKIVHPSGTHILQTVRTAHIISMVTWVFLLAASVTYTILFFITKKPLTSNSIRCGYMFGTSVNLFSKITHVSCTIIFLLVFISMVFFYYSTSCRVLQAQQRQLASSGSEKLVKSRRNMLVLVSIFCVCFVPYHLVRLPYTFLWSSCSVGSVLYYLKEVATMVSVFNISLDPLVYFYLCKTFRAQVNLRKVLRGKNIQQANQESESRKEQADIVTATS
ncbi:P2Y purinoceptor 14-like [Astatotilapia calliptera]|uniref:G-protein coupled receptors family 1 profile domain-containing protein n=1 Tax=Astatotilapia calliptera TaxID=8154 RepID=A0A3P8P622_ASTCA|nr:P2Y purinoceptor 14-like [Astatotilapia calliptera]